MHDPMTQAFQIKYPWRKYRPWPKGVKEWDKMTPAQKRTRDKFWNEGYRETFITIWHVDPCKGPGGDDTCGWFMRAHHGDPEMLEKIRKAIEFDFDRVFEYREEDSRGEPTGPIKQVYFRGLFCPNGEPNYSVHAIVLNMFTRAVHTYYAHDWKKMRCWMGKNLYDILMFAENPTDSLRDEIVGTFSDGKSDRDAKIRHFAQIIYGYILRNSRPWYKHPRWHIRHWQIQCHPLQKLKRFLTQRCYRCKKRIGYNDVPCSDHNGIMCGKCSGPAMECKQP